MADESWIRRCGKSSWVALTRENDITITPNSVSAAMESGARLFILRENMSFQDLTKQCVGVSKKVERFLAQQHGIYRQVKRETYPRGKDHFAVQVEVLLD